MFHKADNYCTFHQSFSRNVNFDDKIYDLFNKKYKFSFNLNWKLPKSETWFSVPPWKVKELEVLKSRLNFHKSQLNDFNLEEWSSHTRRRNPAGEVGWKVRSTVNPEFLTQAWTKFYECASTYNIMPALAITEKKMVSLHLCEAPGAFITSLNHYLKLNHPEVEWKWLASTLNPYYEGNSLSNMINDDRFMFHTLDNWDFGVDNTGNLMNWDNSQAIIEKAKSLGKVMLVTADGSIDCLQRPDAQEEVTSPLHFCEIVTALQALSPGGTLIFKLFTFFEHSTVNLLYLVINVFEEVNIYKPVTSRQGNSEVYAICLNYKGSMDLSITVLKSVYGNETYSNTSLFNLHTLPESFLKQVHECADFFCSIQCQVINDNLQAYLMQNNIALHRNIKNIRNLVATEFIYRYDIKPLAFDQEILKGILHEEHKINMNPRYHRGSYTERQMYTNMSLREKLNNLNSILNDEVLSNPLILINESVRWAKLRDEKTELKLVFTYGHPVPKINSSKFIFVPIFKLYQQILAEEEFKQIITSRNYAKAEFDISKMGIEADKILELSEFDYLTDYSQNEKKHFSIMLDFLKDMSVGETIFLKNISFLSQFNVAVLYILSKKCFEQVGFTSSNSIVLINLINKSALGYLETVEKECKKLEDDANRDVLNALEVQTTNYGEFYTNIVFYNNTFYRNKCVEYLMKIEKFV